MVREGIDVQVQMEQGWFKGNLITVVHDSLPALMAAHPVPKVENPQDRVAKLLVKVTVNKGQVTQYETAYFNESFRRVGETRYHKPDELSKDTTIPST